MEVKVTHTGQSKSISKTAEVLAEWSLGIIGAEVFHAKQLKFIFETVETGVKQSYSLFAAEIDAMNFVFYFQCQVADLEA